MPYGITQCYRGDIPALIPAEAGTRLSDPGDAVCRTRRDLSAAFILLTLTLGGGVPFPSLSVFSLLPLEVVPIAARGSGERIRSYSGSGRQAYFWCI